MLSVIIPAYNEEKCIKQGYMQIQSVLSKNNIESEFIFVDDGSKDQTYKIIKELSSQKENIVGLHFSRNFGKESAISAGLEAANGDCAVVIDCDLQHPPEKIIEMYRLWEQGYEIVEGVKKARGQEKKLYNIGARLFYSIISRMAGFDMSNSSDFKLLDRKVIDVLNKMPERGFFRAISYWIGYNKATVEFDVQERVDGESKWSASGLIKYAISNISSYSAAPMQTVTVLGFVMLIISLIFGVWALIDKIVGRALEGMTTVIIITIFIGSIIMISLGIMGYYIARIYEEIKGRPKYIISSSVKSEKKNTESLLKGIENNEFKMYLQFVVDSKSQKIISAEALSRWDNPQKGIVSPVNYIGNMEATGLISKHDFYMFELACSQLEKWRNTEYKDISISCNFTRITLSEEDFIDKIKRISQSYDFDKTKLAIEISEDAIEKDRETAKENVKLCKELGFRIYLDDLGSGYTSLSNLCDYPIDVVKIDRDILLKTNTVKGKELFSGIVSLAHSLNIGVICEGVETKEQSLLVSESGCDYIQGWLYSKPIPSEDSESFVKGYNKE